MASSNQGLKESPALKGRNKLLQRFLILQIKKAGANECCGNAGHHLPCHGLKQAQNWWRRCQSSLQLHALMKQEIRTVSVYKQPSLDLTTTNFHNKQRNDWLWLAILKLVSNTTLRIYCRRNFTVNIVSNGVFLQFFHRTFEVQKQQWKQFHCCGNLFILWLINFLVWHCNQCWILYTVL